jgi:hypothetical protein
MRSTIRASIFSGNVVEFQDIGQSGDRLAVSDWKTLLESSQPALLNFAWVGGAKLLTPGTYTVRLQHEDESFFTYQYTDSCAGMMDCQ